MTRRRCLKKGVKNLCPRLYAAGVPCRCSADLPPLGRATRVVVRPAHHASDGLQAPPAGPYSSTRCSSLRSHTKTHPLSPLAWCGRPRKSCPRNESCRPARRLPAGLYTVARTSPRRGSFAPDMAVRIRRPAGAVISPSRSVDAWDGASGHAAGQQGSY